MEKKGIRTEKGEFNRWIKATNAVIRDIKKKIALLFDWIAEAKAELAKPQAPDLVSLLNAYYTQRRAGAYSQKGKVSNLKEMNETFNYLRANGIYSLEDLEHRVSEHSAATESLKKTLDEQTARMKAIKQLYDSSAAFQSLKPVYDGLQKIKFEKPRAKYKAEHETELKQFYAARRKLTGEFPDGKVDMKKPTEEYDELEQAHNTTYLEYVCVNEIGDLIKPHYVTESFPKLLKAKGMRQIRYHDLRHSCASLLLANGVPMKQIQEWLGHSDFSTTANIYAHLDYSSKLTSADAMLNGLGFAQN